MPNVSRSLAVSTLALVIAACSAKDAPPKQPTSKAVLTPSDSALAMRGPDTVRVRVVTGKGAFVIEAYRDWAPHGVDRFNQLVAMNFFDGARFFRVIDGFMAQFGIPGDPKVAQAWDDRTIPADSVKQSNVRGTVTFAMKGSPDTRATQLYINLVDNKNLDGLHFAPIGRVVEGMNVVDGLFNGYGEGFPNGNGPDQGQMMTEGNAYLRRMFPRLDSIVTMTVAAPASTSAPASSAKADSAAPKR